jgi:hypothetical protein
MGHHYIKFPASWGSADNSAREVTATSLRQPGRTVFVELIAHGAH